MNTKDLNFFKKVYKFHGIGNINDDALAKKKKNLTHSYLQILTNLKLRFEVAWFGSDLQKTQIH